jgi:Fuc2NAc and GlcNAc transferase
MILILTFMVLSTLVAWGVASWVRRSAKALGLEQLPNHRSSHDHPISIGGGLGIVVAGSLAGVNLVLLYDWTLGWFLLGLGALLAAVGFRDDIQHLPARLRFGVQVLVCMGILFAIGDLPDLVFSVGLEFQVAGWFLFALLLLVGVWWINLFNFMDGIDGIAGAQAVFMLLAGAALAVWTNAESVSSPAWQLMLFVALATVGFLLLNWPPAKIFMGDVGSTWLPYTIFALALISVQSSWLSYASWLVLAAVFVTDTTTTLISRVLQGECWFEAHSTHAYQRLSRLAKVDRNTSHRLVTLLVIAVNVLWLAPLAWACLKWPSGVYAFVVIAYLPLFFVAFRLGAGKSGHL